MTLSMYVISNNSLYEKTYKMLSTSVLLSTAILVGCNNTKSIDIASVPTPEAANLHRDPSAQVSVDTTLAPNAIIPVPADRNALQFNEVANASAAKSNLVATTSNQTKFSSKTFGVKGSPRVTNRVSVRKGGGRYQIGKPYTIRGKKYFPKLDPNLRQTGLASWYGPNFHGRLTANGEVYDQYGLSAAHPTMPLPSYAKVTNLENGSSITVRVNDRGPFSKSRVIDLSARAAQLLGYTKQGVAKVKVEYAGKAPLHGLDEKVLVASYNPGSVNQASIPPLPGQTAGLARKAPVKVQVAENKARPQPAISKAPVTTDRINNAFGNVPRPTGLVNSYVNKKGSSKAEAAFNFIAGNNKLEEPQTGMKNLVRLEFGPFKNINDIEIAEKLFSNSGILQRVDENQTILLITAEEDTGQLLEAAENAGIRLFKLNK